MSQLLSLKRVAERLDVSEKTVRRWMKDGEFPAPTHHLPGGNSRWLEVVVEGWMALLSAGQSGSSATPVKGKVAGTNGDNAGQDGTNGGPDGGKPKARVK